MHSYSLKLTSVKSGNVVYVLPSFELNMLKFRLFRIKRSDADLSNAEYIVELHSEWSNEEVEQSEKIAINRETYLNLIQRHNSKVEQLGIGFHVLPEGEYKEEANELVQRMLIARKNNEPIELKTVDINHLLDILKESNMPYAI